jgi:RNA polymerase sigma-70 factor (ECF subfamily)
VEEGWEEVYAATYRRLVALVAVVAGSRSDAEEAVQEAFVRALGFTGRRGVVDDPEAWLYRVSVNIVRTRWRRRLAGARAVARIAVPVGDAEPNPVDDRLALLAALRRLAFAQREALALHYFADLPVEEIAHRLGVPVGTVKARLYRGRAALARELTETVEGGSRHV